MDLGTASGVWSRDNENFQWGDIKQAEIRKFPTLSVAFSGIHCGSLLLAFSVITAL
jgi:hypothetical protein